MLSEQMGGGKVVSLKYNDTSNDGENIRAAHKLLKDGNLVNRNFFKVKM